MIAAIKPEHQPRQLIQRRLIEFHRQRPTEAESIAANRDILELRGNFLELLLAGPHVQSHHQLIADRPQAVIVGIKMHTFLHRLGRRIGDFEQSQISRADEPAPQQVLLGVIHPPLPVAASRLIDEDDRHRH